MQNAVIYVLSKLTQNLFEACSSEASGCASQRTRLIGFPGKKITQRERLLYLDSCVNGRFVHQGKKYVC